MKFEHQLTLMAPYDFVNIKGAKCQIIPVYFSWDIDGNRDVIDCKPAEAEAYHVRLIGSPENYSYTLAECPEFKTADAFVKIIDSILQTN